ncbi:MAG: hypothetical protein IT260_15280, partial [Saprospiraceae bacterium]|nr:hypothetical protein [Saprospiraceae bacterium]
TPLGTPAQAPLPLSRWPGWCCRITRSAARHSVGYSCSGAAALEPLARLVLPDYPKRREALRWVLLLSRRCP